jgi:hypothetical protein
MPTFDDVTSTFIAGLDKITAYIPAVVSGLQKGDRTFSQHKQGLIGAGGTNITFSGLGAQAFGQAVERNIVRSGQYVFKIDAFNLATSHLKALIVSTNHKCDSYMAIPPGFGSDDDALGYYGYTELDVLTRMRDYVLVGVDMSIAIEVGPNGFIGSLGVMRDIIIADMQAKHDKSVSGDQDNYNHMLKREDRTDDPIMKHEMQTLITTADTHLQMAKSAVNGKLYEHIHDAVTSWFNVITPALASYVEEIGIATEVNVMTVGGLIQDLKNAPGGAPVIIYQTPNGGLMVAVGNGNVTADGIRLAIQAYIDANGLGGEHVQITLMGYQNGGKVAQKFMLTYKQNGLNYHYHIENMVVVGSQFTMTNMPPDTNYDVYVSPGDKKAGDKSDALLPIDKYQAGNLAANAVFNVGFGFAAGGPVGAAEGVLSTIVAQGINIGTNLEQDNGMAAIGFADPNGYFANPDSVTLNEYPDNVGINPNIHKDPKNLHAKNYHSIHVVPLESGGEYSLDWAGLRGKTPHYDQSAYLDSVFIADPAATNKYDIPDSDGKSHSESVRLDGPHPLSPPTHYTFENGQPVPSSGN